MREIKFRQWDSDEKYMDVSNTHLPLSEHHYVMQFTGLKDKNGEHEIYEGDMLWDEGRKLHYEVVWEVCGFVARTEDDMFDLASIASSTEVAGNIYENKRSAK